MRRDLVVEDCSISNITSAFGTCLVLVSCYVSLLELLTCKPVAWIQTMLRLDGVELLIARFSAVSCLRSLDAVDRRYSAVTIVIVIGDRCNHRCANIELLVAQLLSSAGQTHNDQVRGWFLLLWCA